MTRTGEEHGVLDRHMEGTGVVVREAGWTPGPTTYDLRLSRSTRLVNVNPACLSSILILRSQVVKLTSATYL